ncbi:MAG: thymidine phosphorylase [Acidobacteria bacterium]|nr:thymidine phosphorylase [Candidatus Sulfomarinibacter kjeldsenii]
MNFVEAIAEKRDGGGLTHDQVATFVRGASDGSLPPEQLAAMLMAICCSGMGADETRWLTEEMLNSGEVWDLAGDRPEVVDKHSTGGVGDTVSLVLAPILAAIGVPVAMMAGRGLGHSQGTLDKLDALPGWNSNRSRGETLDLIDTCGAAIIAQTDDVAPADRTLYALRDVTATVPSLPLIVGSIMSKKLALGAGALILDVKWGSGAFRKTVASARELAVALRQVAVETGVLCEALITDMNQPLGPALGTACEMREALAILSGGGDTRLREVTVGLCRGAMVLRGWDAKDATAALDGVLADGSALAAWERIAVAHGADPDPELLACPRSTREVFASAEGFVTACDGEDLGRVAAEVGAGRRRVDEELAHGAGVLVHVRIGDRIEIDQPVATLLVGQREVDQERLVDRIRRAFTIGPESVDPPKLILGTADDIAESSDNSDQ